MPKATSTMRVRKHRMLRKLMAEFRSKYEDANDEEKRREDPEERKDEEEIREEMEPEDDLQEVSDLEEDEDESPRNSDSDSEESNSFTGCEDELEDEVVEVVEDEPREIEQLRAWAINNRIEHAIVDQLLKILRRRLLPQLPKSAKNFLGIRSEE